MKLKRYDVTQTISMHVASTQSTYITFALFFSAGSILLYLLMNWLAVQLQLPILFTIVTFTLLALQPIVAWLPDGRYIRGYLHRLASFSMAVAMLVTLLLIIFSSTAFPILLVANSIAVTYMIACILLFFFVKKAHKYILFFQAGYFTVFYVAVLVTALFIN